MRLKRIKWSRNLSSSLFEDALRGGNSGPVIEPGKSAASRLIRLVVGLEKGLVMPPAGNRLSAQEVQLLRAWIDQGATWPVEKHENVIAGEVGKAETEVPKHWSFQPIKCPEIPAVRNRNWLRNPIDNFILARLDTEGIEPSPEFYQRVISRELAAQLKYTELHKKLSDLAATFPALSEALTIAEEPAPRRTYIALRGDYRKHGIGSVSGCSGGAACLAVCRQTFAPWPCGYCGETPAASNADRSSARQTTSG